MLGSFRQSCPEFAKARQQFRMLSGNPKCWTTFTIARQQFQMLGSFRQSCPEFPIALQQSQVPREISKCSPTIRDCGSANTNVVQYSQLMINNSQKPDSKLAGRADFTFACSGCRKSYRDRHFRGGFCSSAASVCGRAPGLQVTHWNMAPGIKTTDWHQEHLWGWMMGSFVVTMYSRPGSSPH